MADEPPPKPAKPTHLAVAAAAAGEATQSPRNAGGAANNPPPGSITYRGGLKRIASTSPDTASDASDPSKVICVPHAQEERADDGEVFSAFKIVVRLADGSPKHASHRFSEFHAFHTEWRREYSTVNIVLPSRKLQTTDEDVARRCQELERYLRDVSQVTALTFFLAKFLGVPESDLKAAIRRGKGVTGDGLSASTSPSPPPPPPLTAQSSVRGVQQLPATPAKPPMARSGSSSGAADPPPVRRAPAQGAAAEDAAAPAPVAGLLARASPETRYAFYAFLVVAWFGRMYVVLLAVAAAWWWGVL